MKIKGPIEGKQQNKISKTNSVRINDLHKTTQLTSVVNKIAKAYAAADGNTFGSG